MRWVPCLARAALVHVDYCSGRLKACCPKAWGMIASCDVSRDIGYKQDAALEELHQHFLGLQFTPYCISSYLVAVSAPEELGRCCSNTTG